MIRKGDDSKKTRCLKHGSGNHSTVVASLIWDVQGHVAPPSTQARLNGTVTFATVPEAAPCFVECVVTEKDRTEGFFCFQGFPWTWYISRKVEKIFWGVF